jgi:hypothetical protein
LTRFHANQISTKKTSEPAPWTDSLEGEGS